MARQKFIMVKQRTLRKAFSISGIGLHTGKKVDLTLWPAPDNTGVIFRRIDLDPIVSIPATTQHVSDTRLNTCLSNGEISIATVEHLLSALGGLSIDNVFIDLNSTEPPALDGSALPLAVKRLLDRARGQGMPPAAQLVQGWMVEPIAQPTRQLWIWGAGHVGRALVDVLAPLPGLAISWVDTGVDRFPETIQANVRVLPVADPARAVALAPPDADHLILTYSHALDLELCHRLLSHGFAACGLIGSATKWARFRSRLAALGHSAPAIARIDCPIGNPALGKHPQAIAISVAGALLSRQALPKPMENTGT